MFHNSQMWRARTSTRARRRTHEAHHVPSDLYTCNSALGPSNNKMRRSHRFHQKEKNQYWRWSSRGRSSQSAASTSSVHIHPSGGCRRAVASPGSRSPDFGRSVEHAARFPRACVASPAHIVIYKQMNQNVPDIWSSSLAKHIIGTTLGLSTF